MASKETEERGVLTGVEVGVLVNLGTAGVTYTAKKVAASVRKPKK
jgi:hypothetical protein